MSLAIWFWVIYVLAVVFGFYVSYEPAKRFWFGGTIVNAILFFLVGLEVFGSPVKGH